MCIIRKRAIRPISYIIFTLFYHIKEATSMLASVLTPSSYMAILIIKLTDSWELLSTFHSWLLLIPKAP